MEYGTHMQYGTHIEYDTYKHSQTHTPPTYIEREVKKKQANLPSHVVASPHDADVGRHSLGTAGHQAHRGNIGVRLVLGQLTVVTHGP